MSNSLALGGPAGWPLMVVAVDSRAFRGDPVGRATGANRQHVFDAVPVPPDQRDTLRARLGSPD
ncbi:MAG: hypothetical protein KDB60_01030 [Propionibacteriaceae bacterium]|nr:hypothetical protein [Propionibacteriaceae bacterium]